MNDTLTHFLSDKYRLIRPLGNGAFSTVYLARHQSLESDRAIKIIPKSGTDRLTVLSEARLLKSLHHPGIPIIYDIEEDDENFYLVEEFVQGESLEQFLLHQQTISLRLFYRFAIQLCDIFCYLHSLPLLYQDLKPAHIIVCGNQIKLIDFGSLYSLTNEGNSVKIFGNATYSAPEVLQKNPPTIQSDVYSVGKILEYLYSHTDSPFSKATQHIIQHAINPNPALRYETVEALKAEIQQELSNVGHPHLYQSIVVFGAFCGSGTTHFSISLTSTLNYMGLSCYYAEKNNSNALLKMQACSDSLRERDGFLYYKWFVGLPKYGPGIVVPTSDAQIVISDAGSDADPELLASADLIIMVCGSAPWRIPDITEQFNLVKPFSHKLKIVCNPKQPQVSMLLARTFEMPVYSYFADGNPFAVSRDKLDFAAELLEQKGRNSLFSRLKRHCLFFRKP